MKAIDYILIGCGATVIIIGGIVIFRKKLPALFTAAQQKLRRKIVFVKK